MGDGLGMDRRTEQERRKEVGKVSCLTDVGTHVVVSSCGLYSLLEYPTNTSLGDHVDSRNSFSPFRTRSLVGTRDRVR